MAKQANFSGSYLIRGTQFLKETGFMMAQIGEKFIVILKVFQVCNNTNEKPVTKFCYRKVMRNQLPLPLH
jgi:hypothetical protein